MSRLATCLTFVQAVIIGSWQGLPPVWPLFRQSSSVQGRVCHLFGLCSSGHHRFMAGLASCLSFVQEVIIGSWKSLPPVSPLSRRSSSVHGRACHLFDLCSGSHHRFMAGLATCLAYVQASMLSTRFRTVSKTLRLESFYILNNNMAYKRHLPFTPLQQTSAWTSSYTFIIYIYIYIYIFLWGGSKMKIDITKFNNMADIIC